VVVVVVGELVEDLNTTGDSAGAEGEAMRWSVDGSVIGEVVEDDKEFEV